MRNPGGLRRYTSLWCGTNSPCPELCFNSLDAQNGKGHLGVLPHPDPVPAVSSPACSAGLGTHKTPCLYLCRIVDQEVMAEFQKLDQRLSGAWGGMETLGLQAQMATFLQGAEAELKVTRASLERLHQTRERLCNFLCEDLESFSVADCCGVFHAFGERFLAAVQVWQVLLQFPSMGG